MNNFELIENGIISSLKDYDDLQKQENVTLLVLSDSHGDTNILQEVITQYGLKADALVFCGDGVADLLVILQMASENPLLAEHIPKVVAFVKGNNDSGLYQFDFCPQTLRIPKSVILNLLGKRLWITHGNSFGVYYSVETLSSMAREAGIGLVAFGHTHCPYEKQDYPYLMNPGALSYPRSGSNIGFALMQVTPDATYSTFYALDKTNKSLFGLNATPLI